MHLSMTIEIFRDGTPQSDKFEAYVKDLACPRCTILVYDNSNPESQTELLAKADQYGIQTLPAVALDGKVVPPEQIKKGKVSEIIRKLFHK